MSETPVGSTSDSVNNDLGSVMNSPKPTPEKESVKIQQQFAHVCAQIGEAMHRIELLKKDQQALQEAYLKAKAQEST